MGGEESHRGLLRAGLTGAGRGGLTLRGPWASAALSRGHLQLLQQCRDEVCKDLKEKSAQEQLSAKPKKWNAPKLPPFGGAFRAPHPDVIGTATDHIWTDEYAAYYDGEESRKWPATHPHGDPVSAEEERIRAHTRSAPAEPLQRAPAQHQEQAPAPNQGEEAAAGAAPGDEQLVREQNDLGRHDGAPAVARARTAFPLRFSDPLFPPPADGSAASQFFGVREDNDTKQRREELAKRSKKIAAEAMQKARDEQIRKRDDQDFHEQTREAWRRERATGTGTGGGVVGRSGYSSTGLVTQEDPVDSCSTAQDLKKNFGRGDCAVVESNRTPFIVYTSGFMVLSNHCLDLCRVESCAAGFPPFGHSKGYTVQSKVERVAPGFIPPFERRSPGPFRTDPPGPGPLARDPRTGRLLIIELRTPVGPGGVAGGFRPGAEFRGGGVLPPAEDVRRRRVFSGCAEELARRQALLRPLVENGRSRVEVLTELRSTLKAQEEEDARFRVQERQRVDMETPDSEWGGRWDAYADIDKRLSEKKEKRRKKAQEDYENRIAQEEGGAAVRRTAQEEGAAVRRTAQEEEGAAVRRTAHEEAPDIRRTAQEDHAEDARRTAQEEAPDHTPRNAQDPGARRNAQEDPNARRFFSSEFWRPAAASSASAAVAESSNEEELVHCSSPPCEGIVRRASSCRTAPHHIDSIV